MTVSLLVTIREVLAHFFFGSVPLGGRRRFGPAPAEETAPPQLAQPSPSAYPRPLQNDSDSKRGREESPTSDAKGKQES
jgi:hypothetical protein